MLMNGEKTGAEVLSSGERSDRPTASEAEAAVKTLIRWAGDDPAMRQEFLGMIRSSAG